MSNTANKLASKRFRQQRANLAYRQSDIALNEKIKAIAGTNYKLTIRHHSHQFATPAMPLAHRYNRERTNGITLVILSGDNFPVPVYAYSVCSVDDTYSRLIGRVLAKDNLVRSIEEGNAKTLTVPPTVPEASRFGYLQQTHRYMNQIVSEVAPRSKEKTVKINFHPVMLKHESDMDLTVRQEISKMFGVDTKDIKVQFEYIRRFSNKFYSNQLASHERIKEYALAHPTDLIELDSTGGFGVVCYSFPVEGVLHLIYSTSKCLPVDHFNKKLARKIAINNVINSKIFDQSRTGKNSLLAGIFKLDKEIEPKLLIEAVAQHAIAERFQLTVNHYVGSES